MDDLVSLLYEQHMKNIYRYFYYRFLSKELAEDLTGEVFLTLKNKVDTVNSRTEAQQLMFGIAKNIYLRQLRKKYRQSVTIDDKAFEKLVYSETKKADLTPEDRLIPLLPLLPESQRRVIELRLIDKLSPDEIAAKLNRNKNYVRTNQKRAIKKLRELIAANPDLIEPDEK